MAPNSGPGANPGGPTPTGGSRPVPRSAPNILAGGLSAAISSMSAGPSAPGSPGGLNPTGGLGGSSISGLRPPGSEASPGQLGSPRPLPGLSGLGALGGVGGVGTNLDEPVGETPTIAIRRPTRPEPTEAPAANESADPAPPPPGAHHAARASVPLVGWLPSDDDILPHGTDKRKSRRGR